MPFDFNFAAIKIKQTQPSNPKVLENEIRFIGGGTLRRIYIQVPSKSEFPDNFSIFLNQDQADPNKYKLFSNLESGLFTFLFSSAQNPIIECQINGSEDSPITYWFEEYRRQGGAIVASPFIEIDRNRTVSFSGSEHTTDYDYRGLSIGFNKLAAKSSNSLVVEWPTDAPVNAFAAWFDVDNFGKEQTFKVEATGVADRVGITAVNRRNRLVGDVGVVFTQNGVIPRYAQFEVLPNSDLRWYHEQGDASGFLDVNTSRRNFVHVLYDKNRPDSVEGQDESTTQPPSGLPQDPGQAS